MRADGQPRNPTRDCAELVRGGVRAELADQLVAAGLTARVRDRLLVITEHLDPIAGESRALVPFGAEIVIDDPDALVELVALAGQRIPVATRLILVFGRPAALSVGAPYLRYVRAGSGSPAAPPADWQVRPTRPADRAEVVPLLREALVAGYTEAGSSADPDALDEVAAAVFGQCLTEGWGFVALQNGRFTGHLTVVPDEDELTGASRWDLFDMFVLPPYRGGPSARLLTSAAAARAGDRPLRGHVAGSDANADAVLERLIGVGWQPDDTYWSVPLS